PARNNLTGKLAAMTDIKEIVDTASWMVLGRAPEAEEREFLVKWVESKPDRGRACRQLVWALLTSAEFRFNHCWGARHGTQAVLRVAGTHDGSATVSARRTGLRAGRQPGRARSAASRPRRRGRQQEEEAGSASVAGRRRQSTGDLGPQAGPAHRRAVQGH